MKIGWGWKISLMYGGFVVLILCLVIASSHQHFDLVSKNYYDAEIGYQKIIDAGKNQAALSAPLSIHASETSVVLEFPDEFKNKQVSGNVQFYSPVNANWDHSFDINSAGGKMIIPRRTLRNTKYMIKISWTADNKNYYQESEINLHS